MENHKTPCADCSTLTEKYRPYGIFTGKELFNVPKTHDAVVEGFLYENDVLFITAPPKTGKSILFLQILFSLTSGEPLFGMLPVTKKCRVLFISTEGNRSETMERFEDMQKGLSVDTNLVYLCIEPGLALNDPKEYSVFEKKILDVGTKFDVIMIDPLYTTIHGDMCSQKDTTDWIVNIRKLIGAFNCSIIVSSHPPKDGMTKEGPVSRSDVTFGSRFWSGFYSTHLALSKMPGYHILAEVEQRSGKIIEKLELVMIEPSPLMFALRDSDCSANDVKIIRALTEFGAMEVRRITVKTQLSRATVYRTLSVLMKMKKIERMGKGYKLVSVSPIECL